MSNNTTNINSFAQNMNRTVTQQSNQLAMLRAMQESMQTEDAYVTFDYKDADGNTLQYQIPSYDSVIRRLQAVEESLGALADGKGSVSLRDGSRRTVTLSTIPHTPDRITGLVDPSTFTIDSNWFFEELMFPGARVSIDLTGQIEDTADRVRVTRIILNTDNNDAVTLWENDLSQNSYDYVTLKNVLSQNGVPYYEDEETVELPLVSNQVAGTFQITEDPIVKNGSVWYTLDNITYSTISNDGVDQGQNNILSIGDRLSYQESIFEILEIDQNSYSVRLRRVSGVQSPGVYSIFSIFQDPFREKVVKVRFGAHEMNIIYFKGVSENYNLLADVWSTPVKFSSDDLILEGTAGLQQTPFSTYYEQYIVDWGSEMIANYRDQKIPAYSGHIPNAPVLNSSELRVVQINTQINAAIDTTDVKNTAAEIQSVKSQIESLKQTIASQKSEAQGISEQYAYNALQQQIATNVNDLNNLQTTYSTLVSSFQTIVRENSAVTTPPKYHIRGFFPVPDYKYRDANETIPEEIIGFDIAYRYIKEDSTATQLNTFSYVANDGSEHTGTFTDWVIEQGPMKTKVLDSTDGKFVWKSENIADGTETNINQIDIAISKGEKVEIKVRSISECGYPYNPLRSVWSESVIIDFPPTLATGNQIADLIEEINSDALTLTVQNNLDALGVTEHLKDSVANKNSVNGLYFKHLAENIAYELSTTDSSGNVVVNSISVQKRLDDIYSSLGDISGTVDLNQTTIASLKSLLDGKIVEYDENIYNISTGLIETTNMVDSVSTGLRQILALDRDADGNYHPKVKSEKYTLINTSGQAKSYVSLDNTSNSPDFWFREESGDSARVHVGNVILEKSDDEKVDVVQKFVDIDASILTKASNSSLSALATLVGNVNASVNTVAANLYNVSTAVQRNTNFVDNVSYNNGYGIKADKIKIGSNLTLQEDGDVLSVNGASGSAEVKVTDLTFKDSNSAWKQLSNFYSEYDITKTDFNTLKDDYNSVKSKISSAIGDNNSIHVNNAEVSEKLTVAGAATFQSDINIGNDTFEPRFSGNRVIGQFSKVIIGDDFDVVNEFSELTNLKDTVEDLEANVNSLTGGESGEESIEQINAANANIGSLIVTGPDIDFQGVNFEVATDSLTLTYSGPQGSPANTLELKSYAGNFTNLTVAEKATVKDLEITGTMSFANTLQVNANNLVIDEGNGNTTTILEYIMKLMYTGGSGE